MPYVRDCFWRGREFTSLAQMQAEAVRWCARGRRAAGVPAAGRRRPGRGVRRGREGRAAAAAAPSRSCWPPGRRAKVGPDIHAKVGKALYSVPWRHIGKTARRPARPRRWCSSSSAGSWSRPTRARTAGKQTDFGDYPPEKIAFHMRTPTWCRRQAAEIGPACEQVIGELLAENALYRLRAAQGVLGLADKHDPARLEAACAKAIAAGDPSYRTVKGILAAGTETAPSRRAAAGDGGAAAFLHGPGLCSRNVIPLPGDRSPATP